MKKQRTHSQLKEQEKFHERTNNEIDFITLLDPKFKKNKNAIGIKITEMFTATRNEKL